MAEVCRKEAKARTIIEPLVEPQTHKAAALKAQTIERHNRNAIPQVTPTKVSGSRCRRRR